MSLLGIPYKKALLQGLFLYGYGTYAGYSGSNYASSRFDTTLSVPVLLGAAGVGSGIVGDFAQEQILPNVGKKGGKFMRSDSALLSSMIHAATYIGLLTIYNDGAMNTFGAPMLVAQAVGSDMAADYASNMI